MVKLFLILAILNNACLGDSSSYPIQGIDVSRHQKHIVWGKVSAAKVKFAYIKATEGTDWVDPLFKKNYQAARTNGLVVGGYHFFSFCSDPGLQAKHFIKHLRITVET